MTGIQVAPREVCPDQDRPHQVGVAYVRSPKVHLMQTGVAQIGGIKIQNLAHVLLSPLSYSVPALLYQLYLLHIGHYSCSTNQTKLESVSSTAGLGGVRISQSPARDIKPEVSFDSTQWDFSTRQRCMG